MGYSRQKTVPDTNSDMSASAVPLDASQGINAYMSMMAIGPTCYVMYKASGTPTAQEVVDGGMPLLDGVPISLQPVAGTDAIDPSLYFLAKTGTGAGDVRAIA